MAPIYPAGEEPIAGVSGELIVKEVRKNGHTDAVYCPDFDEMVNVVEPELRDGDLVITLGAGNIYRTGETLIEHLAGRRAKAKA